MLHAKLSASGAKKWLNCPISVELESKIPNKESEYAIEGTDAHALAELRMKLYLGYVDENEYNELFNELSPTTLMFDHITDYLDEVHLIIDKYKNREVYLEKRVDFSNYVPEGFGTSDVIVLSDNVIEIIDLKYGQGVKVSAEMNPQLMLYALGALNDYGWLLDIEKVVLNIIQPRLKNISRFEISLQDLLKWGEEIKPKALQAFNSEGECVVGKHCDDGFCRAKPICRAYADERLKIARFEFKKANELSNDDIAEILENVDDLVKWSKTVKDYALTKALEGEDFKGFKVVEGKSNRTFNIESNEIVEILKKNGLVTDEIYETNLKSLASLEKQLGKKYFNTLLGEHIIKPSGKPTLVPIDDIRPVFNSAVNDFKNI